MASCRQIGVCSLQTSLVHGLVKQVQALVDDLEALAYLRVIAMPSVSQYNPTCASLMISGGLQKMLWPRIIVNSPLSEIC